MAGGCQYSVEVRSRFSLFWDDALNDEDPEKLISKIQSQRFEKSKKAQVSQPARTDTKVELPAEESKLPPVVTDVNTSQKAKPNRSPVASEQAGTQGEDIIEHDKPSSVYSRGTGRPHVRGFRVPRGGGRPMFDGSLDTTNEHRDVPMEPRGRGRFRPRGFTRGRGFSYSDYREFVPNEGRPRRSADGSQLERGQANGVADIPPDGDAAHSEKDVEQHTDKEGSPKETEELVEEEVKSYTLEEYKAMRRQNKLSVVLSTKGTRKANDGRDVFANMVPHRKMNEESDEEIEQYEKVTEEETPFEIDVIYADRDRGRDNGRPPLRGLNRGRGTRPRGDRGTRGRGVLRGDGRGRGFSRGARIESHASAPFIYNDQEFPSLR